MIRIFPVLLLLCTSCVSVQSYNYKADAPRGGAPLVDHAIVVTPMQDARGNMNQDRAALGLIPLVPFGRVHYDAPETIPNVAGNLLIENPREEFAKNLAEEMNASGLFRESFFSHRANDGEYQVRGELKKASWDATMYTYGVSVLAPYLWILCLPAGSYETNLAATYDVIHTPTGRSVFQKSYTAHPHKKLMFLYAPRREPNYDIMLKDINRRFIEDFRSTLQ